MLLNLEAMFQAAAKPIVDLDEPDTTTLWRQGAARRRRKQVLSVSSLTSALAGGALVISQLVGGSSIPAPFIGEGPATDVPSPSSDASGSPEAAPSIDLFEAGERLHCSGIHALPPATADRRLRDLGYTPVWRYMDGTNSPYPDDYAPTNAVIISTLLQADSKVFLFAVPNDAPDAAEAGRYDAGCD